MGTKKYLELSNGRKVRLAWNVDSEAEYLSICGQGVKAYIAGILSPALLRTMAWVMAKEGERLDQRTLELNEIEFGRLMSMNVSYEFGIIMVELVGASSKTPYQEKPPAIHFRKNN
jgi:hypothetical protein